MTGKDAAGYVERLRSELHEIQQHIADRVSLEVLEKDDILALGVLWLVDHALIDLKFKLINHQENSKSHA